MENLIKYLEKLSKVPAQAIQTTFAISKDRIFSNGYDAEGNELKPYSPEYEAFKKRNNWKGPRPNFRVTGGLYEGYLFDRETLKAGAADSDSADKIGWLTTRQDAPVFEFSEKELEKLNFVIEKEMEKIKI